MWNFKNRYVFNKSCHKSSREQDIQDTLEKNILGRRPLEWLLLLMQV